MGTVLRPLDVKKPEHEDDYTPPSRAKVKNEWSFTLISSHTFLLWFFSTETIYLYFIFLHYSYLWFMQLIQNYHKHNQCMFYTMSIN
jgi:hypothetical protein